MMAERITLHDEVNRLRYEVGEYEEQIKEYKNHIMAIEKELEVARHQNNALADRVVQLNEKAS